MNRLNLLLLLALVVQRANGWSFWPFSSESKASSDAENGAHLVKSPVPFEMTDAEETFLAEAKKYMGNMKPLDSCHQIVLNRIKKSCSDINEEELAKLGVQLLNCQSLAENRKTFECTDEMSIAQCTSNMDSETWNSYHIISNRARSVCYATRQQQFRLKTEYAVNQLGKQAGEQLQLMDTLKTGQSKLAHIAADTVEKMTAGQKKLIAQQRRIHLSQVITQHTIENGINRNIEGLSRENSLIDKNHAQLASMTYNINNKLENATKLLRNQEKNLVESHHEILHDLNDIRVKAQDVWNKLDDSADRMLRNQKESTDHYNDTIDNLKRINKTISYLLEAIDATQSKLDDRITWLTHQLMSTGYQISTMVTCLMHAGYFVLSTYGIVFVQAPGFTRIALVVIVPVNALCEINLGSSLTFAYLTALLITVLIGNWIYMHFKRRLSKPTTPRKDDLMAFPLPLRNLSSTTTFKSACTRTPCNLSSLSTSFKSTLAPPSTEAKRKLNMSSIVEHTSTPKHNRASTPRRGQNTPSRRCSGLTKTGKSCRKVTSNESGLCSLHVNSQF